MTSAPARSWTASVWPAAALLVVVSAAVYVPVFNGGFIWDDNVYVYANPLVTAEDGLGDIWLTAKSIEYYPLFYSTLWLEWKFFGMNPTGYHVVNILLHVLNVLLVWRLFKALDIPGALLAALLFAVHPVNTESVAWVSELKNTLSLLFFLLACLTWVRYRNKNDAWRFYALTLVFFLLALFSKTTVVVFPFFILVVAWWKDGRITGRDLRLSSPFFLLALAMGLLLIWFLPHRYPSDEVIQQAGILPRLAGAGLGSWFYLGKVVFPFGLCLVYPHWGLDTGNPLTLLPLILLLGIFWLLWFKRARWGKAPLVGLGLFWLALLPSLGLIVHPYLKQSPVADRWLYLPVLGLVALVGAGWSRWRKAGKSRAGHLAMGVAVAVVALFSVLTFNRSTLFADAETLYRDTLEINPAAVGIRNNLALMLVGQGKRAEAIGELKRAVKEDPSSAESNSNLGNLLAGGGRAAEAIPYLQKALQLEPNMLKAKLNLGLALAELGRHEEAAPLLQEAAAGIGDNVLINERLGEVLAGAGRYSEAVVVMRKVLAQDPGNVKVAYGLAGTLMAAGEHQQAIQVYREIVRRDSREFGAYVNLGNLYARDGRASEAATAFRSALRVNDKLPGALNNLAWLLATHPDAAIRNASEALDLAEKAVALSDQKNGRVFETLAASQAAAGRYDAATASQKRALALMPAAVDKRQIEAMESRLSLYEQGHPYIDQAWAKSD